MATLDLLIVVVSLVGLLLLASWLASRQRDNEDYYLGGRHLPAWSLGLSLAANQVSAISLVGAPAFVALREGGGLVWLQYEMAVPLAMAALILWGVPVIRRARGANVYAAVEERLGLGSRRILAAFFLLGRGLGAGVILYASSLVVDALTGWGPTASLMVVGGVAVAYTTLGGLAADVISDVLQLVLLWGGTLVATAVLALRLGRDAPILEGLDVARLVPLELAGHGLGDGATFAFWPMLMGGLFLYVSYYGCDQTQAQRILAAPAAGDARRALFIAAVIRFPLVLTYCAFGVFLAVLLSRDTSFAASLAGSPPDALVPQFMVHYLPVGVLGVAVAGILAAALSSIDSALNSLSAVTIEEFFSGATAKDGRPSLLPARLGTFLWGAWATLTGLWFAGADETVIELVNRMGSLVYGPVLALFVLAWRSTRADGRSAVAGALSGFAVNLALAQLTPSVSWLWWNAIGFGVAWLVGELGGKGPAALSERPRAPAIPPSRTGIDEGSPRALAAILVAEALVIVLGLGGATLAFS